MWFGSPIALSIGVVVRQERGSKEESNEKRKSLNIIGNRLVGCTVCKRPSWTAGATGVRKSRLRESRLCGSESGLWKSGLCESGSGLRGSGLWGSGLQ
jgi:hypothetical protein